MSEDKEDIKIFAKLVFNEEVVKEVYKVKTKKEIYEALNQKIKEINKTMPSYKAIRKIILSQVPLIKTTTGKIKREKNLEQIMKEEQNEITKFKN